MHSDVYAIARRLHARFPGAARRPCQRRVAAAGLGREALIVSAIVQESL